MHFVFAYLFTAYACYLLHEMYTEWLGLRHNWIRLQQLATAGARVLAPSCVPSCARVGHAQTVAGSGTFAGGQMSVLVQELPPETRTDQRMFV